MTSEPPTTGVFFNDIFRGSHWDIIGDKFRRFPEVLGNVLKLPQARLYDSPAVSEELLLQIHTRRFVDDLKRA